MLPLVSAIAACGLGGGCGATAGEGAEAARPVVVVGSGYYVNNQ